MAATTLVLLAADPLQRLLGERAVLAFERLMGLVLTAVAVEMLLGGIKSVAAQFRGRTAFARFFYAASSHPFSRRATPERSSSSSSSFASASGRRKKRWLNSR